MSTLIWLCTCFTKSFWSLLVTRAKHLSVKKINFQGIYAEPLMRHLHSAPIAAPRATGNNSLNTAVAGSRDMCAYILPFLSLRFQVPAIAYHRSWQKKRKDVVKDEGIYSS